ncbi:MAG TPA: STAS domain-containing protein [Acidimicrobiia bacterium]|jgi:anti-anti-sigma factor|nr:STAS domain-containing protein [Acidimicrobiia bacterium]
MTENRYRLHGDVDTGTAPQVRLELRHAINSNGADLVIDCSELTFIDSTGIAVLLEANRLLEVDGRTVLIVNVPPGPRRVFDALGLTDLLRFENDGMGGT